MMLRRERDSDSDEREVMDEEKLDELLEDEEAERIGGVTNFLAGMLVGALLGAGAALLMAPQRGEVTRKRLRRRLHDLSTDAAEQLDEWKDDARREMRRQRKRLKRRLPTH